MPIRKRQESREQHRLTRSTTRKGFVIRRPAHLGRILIIAGAVLAVILLALGCGTYLKARSDAHRQRVEEGNWTPETTVTPFRPVTLPEVHALAIRPEGNTGDIIINASHNGVLLPLQDEDGLLLYASELAEKTGIPTSASPVDLADDVARVQKRGLNVTCVYRITCFDTEDSAERTYLRGRDLALLREYAEAGMNELLLLGLPAGDTAKDALTVGFLQELYTLLNELSTRPAIGVALPPAAFASDETTVPSDPAADEIAGLPEGVSQLYAGNISPGRVLNQCDYLAMDLRDQTPEGVAAVLPHIRYAYVRYSLRLLVSKDAPAAVEEAFSHGFERVYEMDPVTAP